MTHMKTGAENIAAQELNRLRDLCHQRARDAGWWGGRDDSFVPAALMLIVSELAEAMEGHRKGLMDDHLPHRPRIEVELGDAVIRICDLAGYLGLDLGGATVEKIAYNLTRYDHSKAARQATGGKKY